MITLYVFGPKFGLPDPSPFCMKALVLLKMAGVDFRTDTADLQKAPKGKAPYMDDNGTMVPDSTFIRFHLENTRAGYPRSPNSPPSWSSALSPPPIRRARPPARMTPRAREVTMANAQ